MHVISAFHCGSCKSKCANGAKTFTRISRRDLGLDSVTGKIDRECPENGYRLEWTPTFLYKNLGEVICRLSNLIVVTSS